MRRDPLAECTGFDWDEGNLEKNWETHGVAFWECEEVFLNRPILLRGDPRHSRKEARYYALGRSDAGRFLFVAFTIRRKLIRPISFRDMTTKERRSDELYAKEDSEIQ
jgi:uncharacterized DUF497 family protein